MKHAEFINVWYDYARHVYGPKEHIYILDNGSPIPFRDSFNLNAEPIEFLETEQFTFNPEVFLHVKRYAERLIHGGGVVRGIWDTWKLAIINGLNYFFNEADSLSLVNLKDELVNADVITTDIQDGTGLHGCIDCSNWGWRKGLMAEHITQVPEAYGYQKLSVFDSLDQSIRANGICCSQPNYQYYSCIEHGPYINFRAKYKMKKITDPIIHDVPTHILQAFIEHFDSQVKSKTALEYIKKL
jgi:hypothetical protein